MEQGSTAKQQQKGKNWTIVLIFLEHSLNEGTIGLSDKASPNLIDGLIYLRSGYFNLRDQGSQAITEHSHQMSTPSLLNALWALTPWHHLCLLHSPHHSSSLLPWKKFPASQSFPITQELIKFHLFCKIPFLLLKAN